ncbi:acyl-CoA dehydrogenase [Streptomyces genisteinicus]|uniref:Acyl-CoA dehydrogenase n=1 Tax=Streptomyces genisteinicus TaxID=2768068 RepID=A0A7H0HVA7_9ACTN|nr:acyl-CoA dehydrogenase [Streptomyces genisteinicus]QNP64473.1 acyl-CoA dehydrogenase [Streptomyces genisteinicus]
MSHYIANLRDLRFNLFEVLGREAVYGNGPFADIDRAAAEDILAEIGRLATDDLADSSVEADRTPPVFDPATGTAPLPVAFKKAYETFMDAEWWRLGLPAELGGTDAPPSLFWSFAELVLGANPALWLYSGGVSFARVIQELGTEEQRAVARLMVERQWGATMVLTEPEAGSDVGAGRTKAVREADGSWRIEGVKRFITNAEHDLSENIVHFVLARPEGGEPGTKGLSLFLVPKYEFDWSTGDLGRRNGARVTGVEHKMGLKVSNTCEMTFGDGDVARGWLLGERHDGIRQMFRIIEFARMMVGTKAISTLSTGYLNALRYARERVQGADLTQAADKKAPRVTITHHPDVRRSLMMQKACAEGMRTLFLYTACVQDDIVVKKRAGADAGDSRALNDLLLPILKGYGSERAYEQLNQSLQIFGGSGYLQDFPIEQYLRDARIDTLYEGTTAIQGQDYFFRKIVRDQGRALSALAGEIKGFLAAAGDRAELKDAQAELAEALAELEAMAAVMVEQLTDSVQDVTSLYRVGQNTTRFLMASGDVVVAYLLLRAAAVAVDRLPDARGADRDFYAGKVAAAAFFAAEVLPQVAVRRKQAQRTDNALMQLPEGAF